MIAAARAPAGWAVALGVIFAVLGFIPALALVVAGALYVPSVSAERNQVQSVAVGSQPQLDINAGNSSVSIVVGEPGAIRFETSVRVRSVTRSTARLALDHRRILISTGAGKVAADLTQDNPDRIDAVNLSRSVLVTVPRDTGISFSGSAGGLSVNGTSGPIDARTVEGKVELQNISARAGVRVRTTIGRITFDGAAESGSIELSAVQALIEVSLPIHTNAHLDAASSEGVIDLDARWGVRVAPTRPGQRAVGDLGTGAGADIVLSTRNDIRIRLN